VQQNQQPEHHGIQYQVIPKHGIEVHGNQQIVQQHIIQHQVQQVVDINVLQIIRGMVQVVLQIHKHIHVQQNQQPEHHGIQYQVIPKHGIEVHGNQ
jgi:hypothetical protein